MTRQAVSSSDLRTVGYDPSTQALVIEFKGGEVYQYAGVPPSVHAGLMSASSHGKYFHQNIKGRYSYRRIG